MTDDLINLIERLEAAEEAEQGALILEALTYAQHFSRRWITAAQYCLALAQLKCKAYESAALTLVPEGRFWTVDNSAAAYTSELGSGPQNATTGDATTPALALTIAALKACKAVGDG